jgi:hypothetical protein
MIDQQTSSVSIFFVSYFDLLISFRGALFITVQQKTCHTNKQNCKL